MITEESLLWLKNTPLKNFMGLMEAVHKSMNPIEYEKFIDELWQNVTLMRHMK